MKKIVNAIFQFIVSIFQSAITLVLFKVMYDAAKSVINYIVTRIRTKKQREKNADRYNEWWNKQLKEEKEFVDELKKQLKERKENDPTDSSIERLSKTIEFLGYNPEISDETVEN